MQVGPDIGNSDLNRVIFLSDTRYYMQTYARVFIKSDISLLFDIDTQSNSKGIIYSSEQLNACYQLSSKFF
jgi:hypothetical protein